MDTHLGSPGRGSVECGDKDIDDAEAGMKFTHLDTPPHTHTDEENGPHMSVE